MLAWFSEMFNALAAALLSVLPTSPFSDAIASLSDLPYLGWLNWLFQWARVSRSPGRGWWRSGFSMSTRSPCAGSK